MQRETEYKIRARYACDRAELELIVIPTLARFPQCPLHQDASVGMSGVWVVPANRGARRV
jgi:hypothetical protein